MFHYGHLITNPAFEYGHTVVRRSFPVNKNLGTSMIQVGLDPVADIGGPIELVPEQVIVNVSSPHGK